MCCHRLWVSWWFPVLAQVLDTIYSSSSEDFSASLCSRCITLLGVFLCGGVANAARVYLMQISGFFDKTRTGELINRLSANTAVIGHSLTDNLSGGLLAQAAAGISMVVRNRYGFPRVDTTQLLKS
ncbi:ATP-binding cassette sub-family B member 10, mitochondrial-like [Oncorhynchus masou masou]|uniref:ATP-binding cassette sub-family B member 10, mitochondrial-like n=1 Tax=Oncorhynchus masou masou TaxID=90313 RepID=UPI00318319D7